MAHPPHATHLARLERSGTLRAQARDAVEKLDPTEMDNQITSLSDVIFIGGASAAGKSTAARRLAGHIGRPWRELDRLCTAFSGVAKEDRDPVVSEVALVFVKDLIRTGMKCVFRLNPPAFDDAFHSRMDQVLDENQRDLAYDRIALFLGNPAEGGTETVKLAPRTPDVTRQSAGRG